MPFDIDDPRLTAYVLGELEGAEREEVEQLIEADPEVRRAVEDTRAAGRALEAEFACETGPGLTVAQKEAITADLAQPSTSGVIAFFRITAVAAGLLVLVGVGFLAVMNQLDDSFGPVVGTRTATHKEEGVSHFDSPFISGINRYVEGFDVEVAQGASVVSPQLAVVTGSPSQVVDHLRARRFVAPGDASRPQDGGSSRDELLSVGTAGPPVSNIARPFAGVFFNDAEDGDIRARTENVYDNALAATKDGGWRRSNAAGMFALPVQPTADPKGHPVPYDGPAGDVPPNMQPPNSPTPPPAPPPTPHRKVKLPAGAAAAPATKPDVPVFTATLSTSPNPVAKKRDADKAREARDRLRGGYTYDHRRAPNTEAYDRIVENAFLDPRVKPRSTFGVDVDTASYTNARRFLNHNMLPPRAAVKIEEFVNYFSYNYAEPIDEHPFSAHVEVAGCPWRTENRLVRIGLKGRTIPRDQRPATNLVFLLDVSGSMSPANKLPLVKNAMRELVGQLDERDRVAIVTYSGNSGLALGSTPCNEKGVILGAIGGLGAGGSTNGGAGIEQAYRIAVEGFIEGGANRVILCTDGDFNVGVTSRAQLTELIQKRAKTGVFLSVLGFGMGNLKNATLEDLANKGNGHYAYIDDMREARKMLVEGLSGTLITIAKDVKIQVEFNPAKVAAYRLLGYENRKLAARDFRDDKKDAGEIGAGHTVTALFEVVPAGGNVPGPDVDPLKYQKVDAKLSTAAKSNELLTVKLRYKKPDRDTSLPLEVPVVDHGAGYPQASRDFKFAASVAAFALLLRESQFRGTVGFDMILELAAEGKGPDPKGRRAEFLQLVEKAKSLCTR